ncbi:MAG: hypothetical protein WD770_01825 [Actinomycetota bacterium]
MSRYREALEHLGDTPAFPNDAFERLVKRRTRKRRSTRITAGAVALLVATGGTIGVYAIAGGTDPRPGGDDAPPFFALWPETERDAALAALRRVASGADDWRRLDEETARRFGVDVLGWTDAVASCAPLDSPNSFVNCSSGHPHTASTIWLYRQRSDPMPAPLRLTVQRLLGSDLVGIWSVTKVVSNDLTLGVAPGGEVRPDSVVPATLGAGPPQEGDRHGAGVVVFTDCGAQILDGEERRDGIYIGPTGLRDCATSEPGPLAAAAQGILFDVRTRGGFPGFESSRNPFRGLDRPGTDLLSIGLVPVRVVPSGGPEPPATCPPAPFRPTYLPWVPTGERLPDPVISSGVRGSTMSWTRDMATQGGPSLTLSRLVIPTEPTPDAARLTVRGIQGQVIWIGDPGVGQIRLAWTEARRACDFYELHLLLPGASEEETEEALRRIARSLSEPSGSQFSRVGDFVDAFVDARMSGSGAEAFLAASAVEDYSVDASPLYLTDGEFTRSYGVARSGQGGWSVSLDIVRHTGLGAFTTVRSESLSVESRSDSEHGFKVTAGGVSGGPPEDVSCDRWAPCWRLYLVAADSPDDPSIEHAVDQLRAQGFEGSGTENGEPAEAQAGVGSDRWPSSVYWAAGAYPMCEQSPGLVFGPGSNQPHVVVADFTSEADAIAFARGLDFEPFKLVQVRLDCQD